MKSVEFQWKLPCDPTDLTYFRKHIGSAGHEKILAMSIALHQDKIQEEEMCIDTTVQEKNITFPTDAKQYRKIHGHLLKIARKEGIALTRTHEKEVKQLKLHTRFATHPKNRKRARYAVKRLKTISGRLLREMTFEQFEFFSANAHGAAAMRGASALVAKGQACTQTGIGCGTLNTQLLEAELVANSIAFAQDAGGAIAYDEGDCEVRVVVVPAGSFIAYASSSSGSSASDAECQSGAGL